MKYSQFNSIIPYLGQYALYNTYQNKVIFIENDLKELLLASIKEGIEELKNIHPSFYSYLTENDFLVLDTLNEVEEIKELSKKVDEDTKKFQLTINPTMNCNFKCWYCYETHIKKSRMEVDMVGKVTEFITKVLNQNDLQFFFLSFFGGEPLLYFEKNVIPIIDYFINEISKKEIKYSISFTTNGYLIDDKFIKYFKEKGIQCNLQITLDGYREKHNEVRFVTKTKGSYDEIITNIKKLLLNKFYVRLRINYTNENLEDTYKIADDLADIDENILKEYLLIDYHRVWQDAKVDDLNLVLDKNIERLRERNLNVHGQHLPNNLVDSCYADKRNSVTINYNGDIFKCTARDFKTENRDGYIDDKGNLIWENDSLEKRMNSKFKNKPCLNCRLIPICNGGCSQHALEHLGKDEYCVYSFDEEEKNKVIKAKIDEIVYTSQV